MRYTVNRKKDTQQPHFLLRHESIIYTVSLELYTAQKNCRMSSAVRPNKKNKKQKTRPRFIDKTRVTRAVAGLWLPAIGRHGNQRRNRLRARDVRHAGA